MPTYGVSLRLHGWFYVVVEAANREEAVFEAMQSGDVSNITDWETEPRDAEVELLSGTEEDDSDSEEDEA